MSVSPDDFLMSAKTLTENKPKEIDLRNAISRLYYCCYHHAIRLDKELIDNSGINMNAGVHERLISKLSNYPVKTNVDNNSEETAMGIRAIGYILRSLKEYRVSADYHLDKNISETDATVATRNAERFLDKLNKSLIPNLKTA